MSNMASLPHAAALALWLLGKYAGRRILLPSMLFGVGLTISIQKHKKSANHSVIGIDQ
jgi:hypothetical protein